MNPKRSVTKPTAAAPKTCGHTTTEAILGPACGKEPLDRMRHVPPKWAKHYRRLLTLRARLEAERSDLALAARQPLESFSLEMADSATDEFDHDVALCQLSNQQNALYEIDQALKRIENGTYGICQLSGKPIPQARLNALPWTCFAADVELQLEQERALKRMHLGELRSVSASLSHKLANTEAREEELLPPPNDEALSPAAPIPSSDLSLPKTT